MKRKLRLAVVISLVISLIICACLGVHAYSIKHSSGFDNPPAYLKGYSGFSPETELAIHNACVAWNNTHSSALVYRLTSTHSNTLSPLFNQENEITKGYRGENEYLMQTYYTRHTSTTIYEADIDINVDHDFGTASTSYDTQTAITHEIGHLLGLTHSSDRNAIMYESLEKGEKRSINNDDRNGIAAIY